MFRRLETPTIYPGNDSIGCLVFFYGMIGEGTKRLLIRQDGYIIFQQDKSHTSGQEWALFNQTVPLPEHGTKV